MNNIRWLEKPRYTSNKRRKKVLPAVTVTLYKDKLLTIHLRDKLNNFSDYADIGVDDSKLYLKNSNNTHGWRLSGSIDLDRDTYRRVRLTAFPECEKFIGDYATLHYDKVNDLFYIDSKERF